MIPKKTFCDNKDNLYAVIETPKGSRNKYDYDEEGDFFELGKVLPAGCVFPLDFGFIPQTKGGDGDPVDVLVFSDMAVYPGTVLKCRAIGILEALQKEPGKKKERNDRVVAVALESRDHSNLSDIKDINSNMMKEILNFFKYYNEMCGKKIKFIGVKSPNQALRVIKKSMTNGV